ncbi:unnamed protein product [Bursaphelenchus okinawaensis]|uniref:Uncharacterized protein n=1 Tax=Bursaphelenchus okinawaensis TaxID=465554 RepID=A0A811KFE6_9BILA|nr:unnamed protein product [Bursaphelenchus okinawaensis]CAG9102102.1 unnamed protein product [Bursaphelenchus okinawaensis]
MCSRFKLVFVVFIVALTFDAGFVVNAVPKNCEHYNAPYGFFKRKSPTSEDVPQHFKAPCLEGEDCQIVTVQNFSIFMEGYNDRWGHHDFMNIRSYYHREDGKWSTGDYMKGDKKDKWQWPPYRTLSQHPVVMDGEYKYMCQIWTDHLEFYGMSTEVVKISRGKSWRLHIRLEETLSPEDVKQAVIFEGYIFIDKERVFDIRGLMDSEIVKTTDVTSDRPGKASGTFKANKSCAIDITTRQLTSLDYGGVVFTINGLIVQQRWFLSFCDWVPVYFIRHVHFPPNLVYHFGDIPMLQTHGKTFTWKFNRFTFQTYTYHRNTFMPVVKPDDQIFEFAKTKTTPAPLSATSTKPLSTFTPKPLLPITRDPAKADEVDDRDYTDEPTVETTMDEDYLITDELVYEDASYALMVPFVCIGIGMIVLLG